MKTVYLMILVAGALTVAGMVSVGGDEGALDRELGELEQAVAKANKTCIAVEHDAVYKDAGCKAAYSEVKRVEKELLLKRQILVEKLDNLPKVHQARAERQKAYARLLSFKKRTGLIQRKEKK